MNILITGCAGFIGYHLTNKLIQNDVKVLGIDNLTEYYDRKLKQYRLQSLPHKNFNFIEGNINSMNFDGQHFDCVIHLAAQPGVRVPIEFQSEYLDTNVVGFKKVCDYCIDNGINKIIYASSSSVYKDDGENKFSEESTPLQPKSFYGVTKLFNENYAKVIASQSDLSLVGLRFFTVYGPFGRPDMAYYSFSRSLLRDDSIELYNFGEMSRDMTFIEDVVDGIFGALNYIATQPNGICEYFNIGNNSPIKTKDLLSLLEDKLRIKGRKAHRNSINETFNTHADISKSKALLNYNPKVDIISGISEFIDWFKKYEK